MLPTPWHRLPYFNPRSPHRERLSAADDINSKFNISIHAPLTGSDLVTVPLSFFRSISIHAPLTGSDTQPRKRWKTPGTFQSTLPSQGATCRVYHEHRSDYQFQSTLPSQGATQYDVDICATAEISIHAPLTGSDIYWRMDT